MTLPKLNLPPFPPDYRASGLLLPVTSLPSPYGVGDIGPAALAWIDRLADAGQRWWQFLPLSPTGYGNSPYQPLSSFAGNRLLISPDWLIEDELVKRSESQFRSFPQGEVDYQAVIPFKRRLLQTAWAAFKAGARSDLRPAYEKFQSEQAYWLDDYTLFRALKMHFQEAHYLDWPVDLILRKPAALERARRELADVIGQQRFAQFVWLRQAERLRAYARRKGVGLIGDVPFFVSPDSSDVWANPELFLLDEHRRPRFVGGVPPDYFSAQGQLWGNPPYNWEALRRTGYAWYISRLRSLLAHVDVVRLDHFRGFAAAWHVPAGAPTAESGKWVPGPGAKFFHAVKRALDVLPFVAEDLGMITPDVYALRDEFQLPGMRVLQFAFDGRSDNPYLPHNYVMNTVVYTATHDNAPTRNWFEELPDDRRQNLWTYLKRAPGEAIDVSPALLELAWSSQGALAIAPVQDLLNLGRESRMNVPGRAKGNWSWRLTEDMLSSAAFERLRNLTKRTNRVGGVRDRSPGDNVAGRIGNLTATPFLTEKVVASEGLG